MKELVLKILRNAKGDDLARAKHYFKNFTPEQMAQEHGVSGKTCAQLIEEYQAYEDKIDAAIEWVEKIGGHG